MISPLGIVLLIVAVYLIVKSPRKLQTLGLAVIAFVVSVLLGLVPPLILGIGTVRGWVHIGTLVGALLAVVVAWWHTRSPAPTRNKSLEQPPAKN
jgi:membrane associated rhomboid family serine protease